MSEEKAPATPGPYHSTTKRDGFTVPALQTLFWSLLYALAPLTLIPFGAWFVLRYLRPGLPALWLDQSFYNSIGAFLALATFIVSAWNIFPRAREDFMWIMQNAMVPGDANNNGIPDGMEDLVSMWTQDSNGDGVPDLMDILNKYNGGESTLYIKVQEDDSDNHTRQDELPYGDRLPELARGYQKSKDLTHRVWTGNNGLFQPQEFAKLCAALIAQGYAFRQTPNSAITLTKEGELLFARLVGEGDRIERETGRKAPTYTAHFRPQSSPTPAD